MSGQPLTPLPSTVSGTPKPAVNPLLCDPSRVRHSIILWGTRTASQLFPPQDGALLSASLPAPFHLLPSFPNWAAPALPFTVLVQVLRLRCHSGLGGSKIRRVDSIHILTQANPNYPLLW